MSVKLTNSVQSWVIQMHTFIFKNENDVGESRYE